MWQSQNQFGTNSNMTHAEPGALQHRGHGRSIRPSTTQDYRIQAAPMQVVQDKSKVAQQAEGKPYWQAREMTKQRQNELVVANHIPVKRPPTEQVRFGNYVSNVEVVNNAKNTSGLYQNMQQKSLAEVAHMRAKFSYYQQTWTKLLHDAGSKENPKSHTKFLHFKDVPWPMFGNPDREEMFSQGDQEILNFIFHPDRIGPSRSQSEALEEARWLWNCDMIYDRLLSRVDPQDSHLVFDTYKRVWKVIGGSESRLKNIKSPSSSGFKVLVGSVLYNSGY